MVLTASAVNPAEGFDNAMIQWLVQSAADLPATKANLVPNGLLSAEEKLAYGKLKSKKRRNDWLLGRWTAKQLLQEMSVKEFAARPPLNAFSITSLINGAPNVNCLLPGVTLSISHSNGVAFCAAVTQEDRLLGADIERIKPRGDNFVKDYFTEAEIDLVNGLPPGERRTMLDVQITAIWSAKEATLKALQLGLTVDTRAVSCLIQPLNSPPQIWTPFEIVMPDRVSKLSDLGDIPALMGWWRVIDEYVLCLVAG